MSPPESITFEGVFLVVPSCPALVLIAVYCALTKSPAYDLINMQIGELCIRAKVGRVGQRPGRGVCLPGIVVSWLAAADRP